MGTHIGWPTQAATQKERVSMVIESANFTIVSGTLERDPTIRYKEDGTAVCTCSLRLEESGTNSPVFRTFVMCEAYGKAAEALGERQAGDVLLLHAKLFWRKYHTKDGQDKSSLALLVQRCSVLLPAHQEVSV
jgi:single-stranded DNA-binding protein